MDCPLQTVHMCLLKGFLGVKRTTPNWSVLCECGQEPLQFYWFRVAVRFICCEHVWESLEGMGEIL